MQLFEALVVTWHGVRHRQLLHGVHGLERVECAVPPAPGEAPPHPGGLQLLHHVHEDVLVHQPGVLQPRPGAQSATGRHNHYQPVIRES